MQTVRALLLCTSAFTLTALLAGCGTDSVPVSNSTNTGTGPVPTVTAQAVEVNGVAPNRKQEVQFSEAMDPATINNKTFVITDAGGNPVPGDVSYDSTFNTGIFQPTPALETGTTYTATITTGAASTGGMHLAAPYTYSFTTRADTDSSPLTVTQVSPAANAACVSATAQIMITFNEAPDATTVTAQNIVVTDSNGNKLATTVSTDINTTQVVVTPTSPLPQGTITVTVSGVADLADVAMQQPYTWNFSTACNTGGGGLGAANAFVYVSSSTASNPSSANMIQGWSVAADGTLTAVPGSPFSTPAQIGGIVADKQYLFGDLSSSSGTTPPGGTVSIGTWSIAANGALTLTTTSPAHAISGTPTIYQNGNNRDFVDRAGTTLYDFAQAYAVQSSGSLNWVGSITDNSGGYIADEISFTGDDRYGYSSDCQFGTQHFWAFTHASDGALTYFNPNANVPAVSPNPQGTVYCPTYAAAIPVPDNQHVIFSLQIGTDRYSYQGVNQLAVYTINPADGTLSTTNTSANMPKTTVGQALDYKFDPSGKWLAIAGSTGLELFSYNAGVLSGGTTLIANDSPAQVSWDNAGHLFALSGVSGKLYDFSVVNGTATAAPGSPHTVPTYGSLAVEPGGGTTGNLQYAAPLMDNNNVTYGQVSVDLQGNTTVQLTGATPNGDYFVQFCPAVEPGAPNATTPCFAITEFNTDGSGNGSSTLKFPQEGDWAGDFAAALRTPPTYANYVYFTRLAPNNNNETYTAVLVPETLTNGGADTTASPQDPLMGGSVTYSNGSLKFTVQGAAPDTTYNTDVSDKTVIDGSNTYQLSSFTTDGNGNGTSTTPLNNPGDILQVRPAKDAGFIGGFSIPHP